MKRLPPIYKTKKEAVAICGFDDKDVQETIEKINKLLGKQADNWIVLMMVLRKIMKIKKEERIDFDFGTKKMWEIKRKR